MCIDRDLEIFFKSKPNNQLKLANFDNFNGNFAIFQRVSKCIEFFVKGWSKFYENFGNIHL